MATAPWWDRHREFATKGVGDNIYERDGLVPAARLEMGLRTILGIVAILASAEGTQLWAEQGSSSWPGQVIFGLVSLK